MLLVFLSFCYIFLCFSISFPSLIWFFDSPLFLSSHSRRSSSPIPARQRQPSSPHHSQNSAESLQASLPLLLGAAERARAGVSARSIVAPGRQAATLSAFHSTLQHLMLTLVQTVPLPVYSQQQARQWECLVWCVFCSSSRCLKQMLMALPFGLDSSACLRLWPCRWMSGWRCIWHG